MRLWRILVIIVYLLAGQTLCLAPVAAYSTDYAFISIQIPVVWGEEIGTTAPGELLVLMRSNSRHWEVLLICEDEGAVQWRVADSDDEFQEVIPEGVPILSGPAGDYSPGTLFELKKMVDGPVHLIVWWHSIYPEEEGEDGAIGGQTTITLE